MSARHLYVHVPFCARRCVYCDFSIAVRRAVPVERFVASIRQELDVRGLEGGSLETLYLGGGTPSQLGGEGVARLLDVLRARFHLTQGAEVTIEANPEDVTTEAAMSWARAGVNRASLGVQSFSPAVLQWMHRGHDTTRVSAAVHALRDAGIQNLSLDLIYALPGELGRQWEEDVEQALALEPDHLSFYGLTVEPRTPLGRRVARGLTEPGPEELHEEEFLDGHRWLTSAGFEHYEVSNYGLPGRHSRHNSAYWNSVAYHGVGPSAHGFDGLIRRWNTPALVAWEEALRLGTDPVEGAEQLSEVQRALEDRYFDLRTTRGTHIDPSDQPIVDQWVREGWAEVTDDTLRLTPPGWLRLDALLSALTQHRSRY